MKLASNENLCWEFMGGGFGSSGNFGLSTCKGGVQGRPLFVLANQKVQIHMPTPRQWAGGTENKVIINKQSRQKAKVFFSLVGCFCFCSCLFCCFCPSVPTSEP